MILETALLTSEEKVRGSLAAKSVGADFVKTSTGFGPGGATPEDVRLIRATVGPGMGIKAAGGVRTLEDLRKMVEAGATRIGSSASMKIVEEALGAPPSDTLGAARAAGKLLTGHHFPLFYFFWSSCHSAPVIIFSFTFAQAEASFPDA